MFSALDRSHLLSEDEVADILAISAETLRKWRHHGTGPVYQKMGQLVRYSIPDLEKYLRASRVITQPFPREQTASPRAGLKLATVTT